MALRNPKAGKGACPTCGAGVWFRKSASGKLAFTCETCDSSGYAEQGGQAQAKWLATVKEPIAAPPAPAASSPSPAVAAAKAGFDPLAAFRQKPA